MTDEQHMNYAELVKKIASEAPEGTRAPWIVWSLDLLKRIEELEMSVRELKGSLSAHNDRTVSVIYSITEGQESRIQLEMEKVREEIRAEIREMNDKKNTP
jgi:hypothetical protein